MSGLTRDETGFIVSLRDVENKYANNVCIDNDSDDYGDPGHQACPAGSQPDCDDIEPNVNPGMAEAENCSNGIGDDCDTHIDDADSDCGYSSVAYAEASVYGARSLTTSGALNALALLLIPVGAVVLLRIWRRKR